MDDEETQDIGSLVLGPPVVVGREGSMRAAARQLEGAGVGAALVGQTRRVEGIISEHHIADALARGLDLDATPVHSFMTPYLSSVDTTTTIDEAKRRVRHIDAHFLGVTAHGEVVGLLSAEDVLRVASRANS